MPTRTTTLTPAVAKARALPERWTRRFPDVEWIEATAASAEEISRAHDRRHVGDLLSGRKPDGLGSGETGWLPWHAGCFLTAARLAWRDRRNAGALAGDADVVFYFAGVDPHVDDDLGGLMTTDQIRRRENAVFSVCRDLGVPVAWTLGGGYQKPLEKVLALHDLTADAAWRAEVGAA